MTRYLFKYKLVYLIGKPTYVVVSVIRIQTSRKTGMTRPDARCLRDGTFGVTRAAGNGKGGVTGLRRDVIPAGDSVLSLFDCQ